MRKGVTFLFGTGFRDLILTSFTRGRVSAYIIDETVIQGLELHK